MNSPQVATQEIVLLVFCLCYQLKALHKCYNSILSKLEGSEVLALIDAVQTHRAGDGLTVVIKVPK